VFFSDLIEKKNVRDRSFSSFSRFLALKKKSKKMTTSESKFLVFFLNEKKVVCFFSSTVRRV